MEQLSTHAARCSKNKSPTLSDVLTKLGRKRESRARDKLRGAKRLVYSIDELLEELDIHRRNPLHVSLFNFLTLTSLTMYPSETLQLSADFL
jgi:hypothetical protein